MYEIVPSLCTDAFCPVVQSLLRIFAALTTPQERAYAERSMTTMKSAGQRFDLFAQTAPGLEAVTAAELKGLGLKPHKEIGGVGFRGDLEQLYDANLRLRTASRVVVRIGKFYASTFSELERRAKKIAWENFLPKSGSVRVRVTCRKSRLYHSDAVAERILKAVARVAPAGVKMATAVKSVDDDLEIEAGPESESESSQLFIVRIVNDQCEVSADSSGALLHRRGYRREVAKAPLRETLAAAVILACAWKDGIDLLDPLCGSGTIPIEAALIARRIAPGINREFQFSSWPSFSAGAWTRVRDRALGESRKNVESRIVGSDRDEGAIASATRNADRAGVGDSVEFQATSLSGAITGIRDRGPGWILTNPPYGVRVGETQQLRNLYATLGTGVAEAGWNLGVLSAEEALARQLDIPLRRRLRTQNGGIPVDFLISRKDGELTESSAVRGVGHEGK